MNKGTWCKVRRHLTILLSLAIFFGGLNVFGLEALAQTLRFIANDGTDTVYIYTADSVSEGDLKFYYNSVEQTELPNHKRDGYVFDGWEKDGTVLEGLPTADNTTNVITYKAKYTDITYTIQYHSNGGKGTVGVTTGLYDKIVTLASGSGLSKNGYTFKGWAKSDSATVADYVANESVELGTVFGNSETKKTTLYAVWGTNYTATLDPNYEGSTTTSVTGYEVKLTTPSRNGYNFDGWYTASEGGTRVGGGGDTITLSQNITYYAHWSNRERFLEVNLSNTSIVKEVKLPTDHAMDTPYLNSIFGDSGYLEVSVLNSGKANKKLKDYIDDYYDDHDFDYDDLDIRFLEITPHYVGTTLNDVVEIRLTLSSSPDSNHRLRVVRMHNNEPEKFDTLSSRPNDTEKFEDGTSYQSGSTLYIYTKRFSEYAVAYVDSGVSMYTVSFNLNGATGVSAISSQTVPKNGKASAPSVVRSGYTVEWYKEAACTNKWDFSNDKVTGNMTLYAKWIQNGATPTPSATAANAGRAAKTLDKNTAVWLWLVVILAGAGVVWFATGGLERINRKRKGE